MYPLSIWGEMLDSEGQLFFWGGSSSSSSSDELSRVKSITSTFLLLPFVWEFCSNTVVRHPPDYTHMHSSVNQIISGCMFSLYKHVYGKAGWHFSGEGNFTFIVCHYLPDQETLKKHLIIKMKSYYESCLTGLYKPFFHDILMNKVQNKSIYLKLFDFY